MRQVLEIIENGKPDGEITDWYRFLGFCDFHRISGYISDKVVNAPPQVNRHLRIQKNYQEYRQNKLTNAAREIEAKLVEKNIPHAFLKGIVLNGEIYSEGQRGSNDIDILIEPSGITPVTKILSETGFTQGLYKNGEIVPFSREEIIKRRMNRGETAPFLKLTGDGLVPFMEVDINFSLDWLPAGKDNNMSEFLANCTVLKNGLTALDNEYTLLYLCGHLYKEAVVYSMVKRLKDIELYKYLDIFLMLKKINIKRFWQLADKYTLRKQCEYAVYLTNKLFPTSDFWLSEPEEIDTVIDPEEKNKKYFWHLDFLSRLDNTGRLAHLLEDEKNDGR